MKASTKEYALGAAGMAGVGITFLMSLAQRRPGDTATLYYKFKYAKEHFEKGDVYKREGN